ncbi:hypothetical protein KIN20_023648 [Parelaphostrongylus tenuis]|uniref:Uncharacterized protein n=1 Tax=Parelaphostrongylus tenuis TaxID=148309 RepID=A0AAD5N6S0_PARTN|nr:hypothetical protein KIN20_023648 [Parelaphostrongylus tenuis]
MGGLVRSMDWSFAIHGPTTTRVERLQLVRAAAGPITAFSGQRQDLVATWKRIHVIESGEVIKMSVKEAFYTKFYAAMTID